MIGKWTHRDRQNMLLICIGACLIVAYCSTTTTPLMPAPVGGDSAMFQTIGKYWVQGAVPYRDLWDSKGPVIFFINALGYALTGTKTGIFVLQVLNMMTAALLAYRFFRKRCKEISALVWTMLFLLWIPLDYQAGNSVEEYCLPLLMLSFSMIFAWRMEGLKGEGIRHKASAAFVYGLCFGICFLTRITNAVGLCAAVLVITLSLAAAKEWKNLLSNAAAFVCGTSCMVLPFAAYFGYHDALDEMWYGTIAYNLEYADASWLRWTTPSSVLEGCIGYSISAILLIIGFFMIRGSKEEKTAGILWLTTSVVMLIYLSRTNGYLHYGLVAAPFFPISVLEIQNLQQTDCRSGRNKAACRGIAAILCLMALVSGVIGAKGRLIDYYYTYWLLPRGLTVEPNDAALMLCERIPKDEKDSFAAYNCKAGIYLHLDIRPRYRFFTMQDWAAKCSTTLKAKILETYQNGDAKWVLFATGSDEEVYEIIQARYELQDEVPIPYSNQNYQLFRLRE